MEQKQKKPFEITKSYIDKLSPVAIAHDPAVARQVIKKMVLMYHWIKEPEAVLWHEREKDNFSKLVSQSSELRSCTPMSLYFAYMKCASLRLSFDNGKDAQGYLIPGNRNVGTRDNTSWIKEAVFQPSPYGEKEVRVNSGILKKVGEPFIVHQGDTFKVSMNEEGNKVVKWEQAEKPSNIIVASFIRLVEPDGTVKFVTFDLVDVARWQGASKKKNRDKPANELYTSGPNSQIDEGFLKAKTLLHSFKGYKRVDFAYSSPEGFVPDENATTQLGTGYMDDIQDAVYDDTADEVPVKTPAPTDDFAEAVNATPVVVKGIPAVEDESSDGF